MLAARFAQPRQGAVSVLNFEWNKICPRVVPGGRRRCQSVRR
jgi:hypothetical protein